MAEHGTLTRYHQACRCSLCKGARAEAGRRYRAKKRQQSGADNLYANWSVTDMNWTVRAACRNRGIEMFFPDGRPNGDAKAVCDTCQVQEDCLDFALRTNQKHGIWGGLTPPQRQKLRKKAS